MGLFDHHDDDVQQPTNAGDNGMGDTPQEPAAPAPPAPTEPTTPPVAPPAGPDVPEAPTPPAPGEGEDETGEQTPPTQS